MSATGVHAHPSNKVPSGSDSSDPEFKIIDEPEVGEMGIGALGAGMKECQALLNTMEDLDEDSYNKVLEKLHGDVLWRQMFLDMPEKRRIAWIKKL
ncbi:hypothetical protein RHGRI_003940 [Rhododendron griersonianum]|uniref:Uncharacterized protein n=1 Tax=Rhododendron griersonianum TaxID=479676 RepID=A0AAV6L7L8_9ERIC|nr:hypothetical protein RHGRI_003940 [Rhododendron griersonianum]